MFSLLFSYYLCWKVCMASDLCIERNDSKWKIRDSPAKKQRCEDYGSPPPLCSSAEEEEEKEKEKEDPRSKVVFYNYDDSDVEDDSDGRHKFTDREYQEYNRQITESDVDLLRGQKSDKVDVTLQLEELEVMNNVLHAKYEKARRRRSCIVSGRISVTWLPRMRRRGNGKCRKKMEN
ncbi:unnamed protein product [Camellia sinensis]